MLIVNQGKSTLIGRLLEKNETPKPTLALDFTFARRTTQDLVMLKIKYLKRASFYNSTTNCYLANCFRFKNNCTTP